MSDVLMISPKCLDDLTRQSRWLKELQEAVIGLGPFNEGFESFIGGCGQCGEKGWNTHSPLCPVTKLREVLKAQGCEK